MALLNKGSTLKAITLAFCLIYFLINTGSLKFPGSTSSIILSNLLRSAFEASKIKSLSASFNLTLNSFLGDTY